MIARLTVHLPRQPTKTFLVRPPGSYDIGRDPACHLVLDDARVSRRHAKLSETDEVWAIQDLGSKNGLAIDGLDVDQATLESPCWVSFGGLMSRFEPLAPDSAWTRERERRAQTSTDAMREIDRAGRDAGEVVHRLLDSVLEITRAERGFVLLARAEESDFDVVACRGIPPKDLASGVFSGSSSTVRGVLAGGRTVAQSDVLDDSVLSGRPSVVDGEVRALVCLPLEAGGERLGALYADSRKPGAAFDELDLEILSALTSHAALALRVARVGRELSGLTGSLPTAFGGER